ncbi:MAG: sugar transferase [Sulfurovum sp.]|nr:MAG: sugar transferase [Sulfurovum sp.]
MLSLKQRAIKRSFDIALSLFGIIFGFWVIFIAFVVASIETRSCGLFIQRRVGLHGKLFGVFKIKTMKDSEYIDTITASNDTRITSSGKFFRATKIDELPQLFNVLFGDMSFVGPRPDVEGYADRLKGEDRDILKIRPAITGPATLKYKNEEEILASTEDKNHYNDTVIWPDKVRINKEYIKNWSLMGDINYIMKTIKK